MLKFVNVVNGIFIGHIVIVMMVYWLMMLYLVVMVWVRVISKEKARVA